MARLGLGEAWTCLYANDFDPVKAATYRANHADAEAHFREGDVWAVQPGDLLTTSGVDGVYPPGLPVARVSRIERRAESAFAKIYCTPEALVTGARHVLVVKPVAGQIPPRPQVTPEPVGKKGRLK